MASSETDLPPDAPAPEPDDSAPEESVPHGQAPTREDEPVGLGVVRPGDTY